MLSDEERKALERIEDFLTTNIIVSISNDETADSEELKAFISKNEYLAIEFIASMFLKQSKEIEEYKKQLDLDNECEIALNSKVMDLEKEIEELKDTRSIFNMGRRSYKNEIEGKIKAKLEELKDGTYDAKIVLKSLLEKE